MHQLTGGIALKPHPRQITSVNLTARKHRLSRRSFLRNARLAAAALATRPAWSRIIGADDRINVGVVGQGARGSDHLSLLLEHRAMGNEGDLKHVDNFLDCVRTRQQPNCHVDLAVRVLAATDLPVRSYWNGRMYHFDDNKDVVVES
jgi:hypothetical protein